MFTLDKLARLIGVTTLLALAVVVLAPLAAGLPLWLRVASAAVLVALAVVSVRYANRCVRQRSPQQIGGFAALAFGLSVLYGAIAVANGGLLGFNGFVAAIWFVSGTISLARFLQLRRSH